MALDDETAEEAELHRDLQAAYKEGRRVLKRVVDAGPPGALPRPGRGPTTVRRRT